MVHTGDSHSNHTADRARWLHHQWQVEAGRRRRRMVGPGASASAARPSGMQSQPGNGRSKARVPNLFWRSYHHEALRRDKAFVALPDEQDVQLDGHGALRYVQVTLSPVQRPLSTTWSDRAGCHGRDTAAQGRPPPPPTPARRPRPRLGAPPPHAPTQVRAAERRALEARARGPRHHGRRPRRPRLAAPQGRGADPVAKGDGEATAPQRPRRRRRRQGGRSPNCVARARARAHPG